MTALNPVPSRHIRLKNCQRDEKLFCQKFVGHCDFLMYFVINSEHRSVLWPSSASLNCRLLCAFNISMLHLLLGVLLNGTFYVWVTGTAYPSRDKHRESEKVCPFNIYCSLEDIEGRKIKLKFIFNIICVCRKPTKEWQRIIFESF